MTNSKRTNPIKPPICINDFLRIAVISLSLFCKSDCTFFSIWQINPCSCLLSSALRAARLSACSDNRRLCAFCSLTMFLLDERSVVVVVVGFVPSFLPKMLKKPFRFGFLDCSWHSRNLVGNNLVRGRTICCFAAWKRITCRCWQALYCRQRY